jgi:hypothetical protein
MDDSNRIPQAENFDTVTEEAQRMLSQIAGSEIRFTQVERLSEIGRRNLILRCLSTPSGNLPSSFIIKKVEADVYDPEDPNSWDSRRFFNDWVGSQFLSSLAGRADHGPHFYGGNREVGFIILEDMGPHRSLVEPLLQEDAATAQAALLRHMTRLGQLHADTVNQSNSFENLFRSLSASGMSSAPTQQELEEDIQKVQALLEGLGVQIESGFLPELREITTAVINPGPFLVYIHADPCPDNVFDSGEQIRLIDFEFGHFGHALRDATYGRMIFPTCWCANRVPPSLVAQMENRYRTELIQGCPQAQEDTVFEKALVTICGFWLMHTLRWHLDPASKEDQSWGRASLRQRILARLEAFMTTSRDLGHFPAVRGTAGRLLDLLGERWPETPSLPLFPAFLNSYP